MKRFIESHSTDVFFHLAAEEYLLKQQPEDVFMLWQNTPSVVLGKHQRIQSEVNTTLAGQAGIHIARRFSGGGTVYHDLGNINLTFIETRKEADFTTYMRQTLGFLRSLGLKAEADRRLGIYIDGLKISGSAQCVHRDRVLYHCTLLYDTDLEVLDNILDTVPDAASLSGYAVPSVRSKVTNIRPYLTDSLSIRSFRELLFNYFSAGQQAIPFTKEEENKITRLRNEKYACKNWTFRLNQQIKMQTV